jgi:hypothetical protein
MWTDFRNFEKFKRRHRDTRKAGRIFLFLLVFPWFCSFPKPAVARDPKPQTPTPNPSILHAWQVEQGLPQNSITAMLQTRDGYMWFATFGGLARFDGVRFTVFNHENTPAIEGNRFVELH